MVRYKQTEMKVFNDGELKEELTDTIKRMQQSGINKLYSYSPDVLTTNEDWELQVMISNTIEKFLKEKGYISS